MNKKLYLRLLQGGLVSSFIVVFFIFSNLLFPYITSKQLVFNLLIEFLLIPWLVFIWKYQEYRPRRSLITWGLVAFFSLVLISCFISVDPALSFWGNAERMLGFFHIFHFFLFYLMIISLFKSWEEWRILFGTSILAAFIMSLGAFVPGGQAFLTLGNTSYVSGYMIFNLYFVVLLFNREKHWTRWLLVIPFLTILYAFKGANTSAAIIGLGLSVLAVIFLLGALHRRRTIKIVAWSVFGLSLAVLIIVFSQYQSSWFQNNHFLKGLTPEKTTFQTRIFSWEAGLKDYPHHPLLGTGFGTYAHSFDKYFNADFYNLTKGETYFDRAHNNVIELLSTTGTIGLAAYLSIFVAAFYYLFKKLKENNWHIGEKTEDDKHNLEIIILIGLFIAYFVQNLALFDSLTTYIGLMITLGFVYWLVTFKMADKPATPKNIPEVSFLIIGWLIIYFLMGQANIAAWQSFSGVIEGYTLISQGDLLGGVAIYKNTFNNHSPFDRDGKVTLINAFLSNLKILDNLSPLQGEAVIAYVVKVAQENVTNNPADTLKNLQLAQVEEAAAIYEAGKDQAKSSVYYSGSLQAVDASIAASPHRTQVYFIKADILMHLNRSSEAISLLQNVATFNPAYGDTYCQLYKLYLGKKDKTDAQINLNKCLENNSADFFGYSQTFVNILKQYYNAQDWTHCLILAKQLTIFQSQDQQSWQLLADIYSHLGDTADAEAAASHSVSPVN